MGLAMSLNLDIDSLPPEKVAAAITRLEAMKARRAAGAADGPLDVTDTSGAINALINQGEPRWR